MSLNTNNVNKKRNFIPFAEIGDLEDLIIVDGQHKQGLVLSHWKGANKIPELAADTSGAIVLNALEQNYSGIDYPNVTATHFDIDGFVGVWALYEPELAIEHDEVLRCVAEIGDFRHFDAENEAARAALKLVCWLNTEEQKHFYRPFGSSDELDDCVPKFEYFLPRFKEVLLHPDQFKASWEEEYNRVMKDWELVQKAEEKSYPHIQLIRKRLSSPIHYYALFGNTANYDIVMSLYDNNRYEVEFKYTTWVDIVSRPSYPRIDMQPLVHQLNQLESSEYQWYCDKITDTGPILRLENQQLSKAERYAHPFEREIYSSSIAPVQFEALVVGYLEQKLQKISPKRGWSWKEMRELSRET